MTPSRTLDPQRTPHPIWKVEHKDKATQDAWWAWTKQWEQLHKVFVNGTASDVQQWIQDHPDFDLHQNTVSNASALGEVIHQWQISDTPETAERRLAMVQTVLEQIGGWRAYAQEWSQLNGWMVPVGSEYTLRMARPHSHGYITPASQGTQSRLLQILVEAGLPLNEPHVCRPGVIEMERFPLDMAMESDAGDQNGGWVASVLQAGADPRARMVDGQRWIDATLAHLTEGEADFYRSSLSLIVARVEELEAQGIPEPTPSTWMAQRQADHQHEQNNKPQQLRDDEKAARSDDEINRRLLAEEAIRPRLLVQRARQESQSPQRADKSDDRFLGDQHQPLLSRITRSNSMRQHPYTPVNPHEALISSQPPVAIYEFPQSVQHACQVGDTGPVEAWLAADGYIQSVDRAGQTLLHLATQGAPHPTVETSTSLVRLLIERGVDPQAKDNNGRMAADYAILQGQVESALLLTQDNPLHLSHEMRREISERLAKPEPGPVRQRMKSLGEAMGMGKKGPQVLSVPEMFNQVPRESLSKFVAHYDTNQYLHEVAASKRLRGSGPAAREFLSKHPDHSTSAELASDAAYVSQQARAERRDALVLKTTPDSTAQARPPAPRRMRV